MSEAGTGYPIVVGIDFAAAGDHAFAMAVELSRELPHAELHLTYVVAETRAPSAERIAEAERLMADAAKKLAGYVEERREEVEGTRFSRPVFQHVRVGDPAEALHQVAVDYDARLIIVGTRGHRGLARLVLGSVSERLVKLAHLPVLVARPRDLGSLAKSERAEAPRPGQTEADLHAPPTYTMRSTLEFGVRSTHVSGNI